MANLNVLGYPDFETYRDDFFRTLAKTNRTYSYFVDWNKIRTKAAAIENEIMLMNVLTRKNREERGPKLRELLEQYPRIMEVIPMIIAVRDRDIMVFDDETFETRSFDFTGVPRNISDVVEFCERSGILELFDQIENLFDYIQGVEVGLDTNARKNRSGTIFEKLVGDVLKEVLEDIEGFSLNEQDKVELKRRKYADFTIQYDSRPVLAVEVNFFSATGSKPIEVARSYIRLEGNLKAMGIPFVWVTDGPGWIKMRPPLEDSMQNMDYILNLEMLREKIPNILLRDDLISGR